MSVTIKPKKFSNKDIKKIARSYSCAKNMTYKKRA